MTVPNSEDEDFGKGCFWMFLGIGGCIFLASLGIALINITT